MDDPINDKLAQDRKDMLASIAAIHGPEGAAIAGCALGILSSFGRFLGLVCTTGPDPLLNLNILQSGMGVNTTINTCVAHLVAHATKGMSQEKRQMLDRDIRALCQKDMEALQQTIKSLQ